MTAPTPPPSLHALEVRCRLVARVRAFFAARAFFEVDTPVAIRAPAPEAAIDAVAVRIRGAPPATKGGAGGEERFLQTSPELAMKRLVARGLSPIYQIAPVFRDGDEGPWHCPEFRLLEWYRAPATYTAVMQDCTELLQSLVQAVCEDARPRDADHERRLGQLARPPTAVRLDEALLHHAGIALPDVKERGAFAAALLARGVHHAADDDWSDLFHRLFVGQIEPALLREADGAPFFVTHFPAQLASLAQLHSAAPWVAERFELYAGGVELANGFGELRDAREQRRRFEAERATRRRQGKLDYPLDEAYLAALPQLPPTAGVAVGLERLLAVVTHAPNLAAVATVPWRDA